MADGGINKADENPLKANKPKPNTGMPCTFSPATEFGLDSRALTCSAIQQTGLIETLRKATKSKRVLATPA
jgi:hypothetical protein